MPWSPEQKAAFLGSQFQAQHTHYQANYPGASFDVIQLDGRDIGRLYVERGSREIRVIDIALLPEQRGRGIGTYYMQSVQDEAAATGRFVGLHVEAFNRARQLYLRLGFEVKGENGPYLYMEWRPS